MYKQTILTTVLLLSSIISFSQEIVNSTPVTLKKDRDVFQIVDNTQKETTLFISDKTKVKAIRLDEKMQIMDSVSAERPDTKIFTQMIGYNTNESNPRLFWSSNDFKKIYTQLYNFNDRKTSTQEYQLPLKDERFLQKFSENKKLYILTILKNSNTLKLYVFDNEGKLEEKHIELTDFHFFKSTDYKKTNLYGILGENLLPFEPSFSLQKINTEDPTSLTYSAKRRKCYSDDNKITLTIDTNFDYSQLIIINLEDYTASEKIIKKPYLPYELKSDINSNSFLIDNKLYQIKSSPEKVVLTLKDLDDNLIKEYSAAGDIPIAFKNSDIIQENGSPGSQRTLENTSQFIRKVNNLNSGVSCYQIGENNLITLGSVSEVRDSNSQILGQFGAIGALVAVAISNPSMESFNSYANRKVVKIDCLFGKDFNHIKGDVQPLAFDKIRSFFDANRDVSSQTLFKMNSLYYLGYYDNKTKEYIIRKFTD